MNVHHGQVSRNCCVYGSCPLIIMECDGTVRPDGQARKDRAPRSRNLTHTLMINSNVGRFKLISSDPPVADFRFELLTSEAG